MKRPDYTYLGGKISSLNMRRCNQPKCGSEEKGSLPQADDECYSFAGDYYDAEFVTGPDFGCIHHEPKP